MYQAATHTFCKILTVSPPSSGDGFHPMDWKILPVKLPGRRVWIQLPKSMDCSDWRLGQCQPEGGETRVQEQ